MSVHISAPVWKVRGLSMTQKIVLLKLADNANESGICWPSLNTIAEDCGCSVRTVSRAIAHFESINLISHDRRYSKSNMYHFNMDTLSTLASDIDTESTSSRQTVHMIRTESPHDMDTQSIDIDTVSNRYGHPCPTNRKEPSENHQLSVNESSEEPSEEDYEYEDPFDEADSIRLKKLADQRKFG